MIVHNPETQTIAIFAIRDLDLNKKHEVKIEEYKTSKTLEQLRLYWKWVKIIGDEFGYHKDDMSEYLKAQLITPTFVDIKGKTRSVRPSISSMRVNEMSEYLDSVSRWAGEQGIALPHPEDVHVNS